MFSICRQSHPATAVEHAISCYFFNKVEKCLVTAGANILKVFRLVPDVDPRSKAERYSGKELHFDNFFKFKDIDLQLTKYTLILKKYTHE